MKNVSLTADLTWAEDIDLSKYILLELHTPTHNYSGFNIIVSQFNKELLTISNCESSLVHGLKDMFTDLGYKVKVKDCMNEHN